MELVLKTDSEEKAAMIIALAKKLDVLVIETKSRSVLDLEEREALKQKILFFQPAEPNKSKLSSLLAGSINKEKAAELHKELEIIRGEWD